MINYPEKLFYRHNLKAELSDEFSEGTLNGDIHFHACFRLGGVDAYIASFKYMEFENTFVSARFALIRTLEKDLHLEMTLQDDWYVDPDMELLKYTIMQYNACYDYLLSVIYFAFSFNDNVDSSDSYRKTLRKCHFGTNSSFYKAFKDLSRENSYAKELFNRLIVFNKRAPLNDWANKIKHTGDLWLGPNFPQILLCKMEDLQRNYTFEPQFIEGESVSVKEVQNELCRQNNRIVEFARYLYEFIGFDELHTTNGDIFSFTDKKILKKFTASRVGNPEIDV